MSTPTMAELIKLWKDKRITDRDCHLCGNLSLFKIANFFTVCLICDTTGESRRDAELREAA